MHVNLFHSRIISFHCAGLTICNTSGFIVKTLICIMVLVVWHCHASCVDDDETPCNSFCVCLRAAFFFVSERRRGTIWHGGDISLARVDHGNDSCYQTVCVGSSGSACALVGNVLMIHALMQRSPQTRCWNVLWYMFVCELLPSVDWFTIIRIFCHWLNGTSVKFP